MLLIFVSSQPVLIFPSNLIRSFVSFVCIFLFYFCTIILFVEQIKQDHFTIEISDLVFFFAEANYFFFSLVENIRLDKNVFPGTIIWFLYWTTSIFTVTAFFAHFFYDLSLNKMLFLYDETRGMDFKLKIKRELEKKSVLTGSNQWTLAMRLRQCVT